MKSWKKKVYFIRAAEPEGLSEPSKLLHYQKLTSKFYVFISSKYLLCSYPKSHFRFLKQVESKIKLMWKLKSPNVQGHCLHHATRNQKISSPKFMIQFFCKRWKTSLCNLRIPKEHRWFCRTPPIMLMMEFFIFGLFFSPHVFE